MSSDRIPAQYSEAWNGSAFAGEHGDVLEEVCRRIRDFCEEIHAIEGVKVCVSVSTDEGRLLYTFREGHTKFVARPPKGNHHDEG